MAQMDAKQVIETQRQDWSRVAPAWERWDRLLDHNLAFINYRLVGDTRLRAGQRVLDLGCGTGYPALLAAQAVGPRGSVVGLDLADAMLDAARRKAQALGLTNLAFQSADATTLPFGPAAFDAVISRFCLMFLPDIPRALNEAARVLTPGGYLAATVWSAADKNPFLAIPMEVLKRHLVLPPPDSEQPGIFRLARPRDLFSMVEQAGLRGLAEDELPGESWYESADEYLASLIEMAAPIQPLFAKLSPMQQHEVKAEITEAVNRYRRGPAVALPMAIRLVVARKPW